MFGNNSSKTVFSEQQVGVFYLLIPIFSSFMKKQKSASANRKYIETNIYMS